MSEDHGSRPQEAVPTESPVVAGTMLEKAAKARWDAERAADRFMCGSDVVWERLHPEHRESLVAEVRAALQAIREPDRQAVTRGMVAMMTDDLQPTRDEVAAGFTAMIDAILSGEA